MDYVFSLNDVYFTCFSFLSLITLHTSDHQLIVKVLCNLRYSQTSKLAKYLMNRNAALIPLTKIPIFQRHVLNFKFIFAESLYDD